MTIRVLLATDGSDDARTAGAWLARFPLPAGSRLRVVSVVDAPPSALALPPVHDLPSLRDGAQRTALEAQAVLARRVIESDAQVLVGEARHTILRTAEEWQADLVVLGARGLGAVAGFLLGSVSLGVARHAPCSVAIVKAGTDVRRGIVIGIDGSDGALAAARFVAALPLDPMTVVRLTGVVQSPPAPATTPGFAKAIVRKGLALIVKDRTEAIERGLDRAAAFFEGVVKNVERQVLHGHPTDALLGAAASAEAGLIVVGARGLGSLERLLLGSVSESVLSHADRPVLIVRRRVP